MDNAGNRTAKTDQRTAVATSYGYDAIYQLLSATQGATTTESYAYDPVGNRTASLGVSSYTTNSSNELTATSSASYGYDLNGNAVTKNDSTGITTYAWDYENRLTSVTLPGSGGTISFAYDPLGRRIKKVTPSATSIFAYDGDNLIEETNSSGTAVARYSQGLHTDEPFAMLRGGATNYYHVDGLNSVTSLSSAAGSLAQTYTYDSFGKQNASSGSLTNPLQYTSREWEPETSLYYYRARYFDQDIGRFLNEDPIGFKGGQHFYMYARNNPIIFIDPTGLNLKRYDPNPKENTIICNGAGGLEIQLGNVGSPKERGCLEDCYRAHEASHLKDITKYANSGTICKGIVRGVIVGFSTLKELNASEVDAANAEIDCLKKKQKHECAGCFQIIIDAIAAAEDYRAKHQQ